MGPCPTTWPVPALDRPRGAAQNNAGRRRPRCTMHAPQTLALAIPIPLQLVSARRLVQGGLPPARGRRCRAEPWRPGPGGRAGRRTVFVAPSVFVLRAWTRVPLLGMHARFAHAARRPDMVHVRHGARQRRSIAGRAQWRAERAFASGAEGRPRPP